MTAGWANKAPGKGKRKDGKRGTKERMEKHNTIIWSERVRQENSESVYEDASLLGCC